MAIANEQVLDAYDELSLTWDLEFATRDVGRGTWDAEFATRDERRERDLQMLAKSAPYDGENIVALFKEKVMKVKARIAKEVGHNYDRL
jgi:hypothetical protein